MPQALPPPPAPTQGGLLLRVGERRFFITAEVAVRLAPCPQVARFPGAPPGLLGLALSDGAILPVIELGPAREAMIVCTVRGEQIGLLGAEELETGVFEVAEGAKVVVKGRSVAPLDLDEIYARIHAVTWGASWGG